jgi:predicted nucleic acid-binding protein
MVWIHESPEILQRAAVIKATHPLSVADAWIAATALEMEVTLVHKDPEFEHLPELLQERLPYK